MPHLHILGKENRGLQGSHQIMDLCPSKSLHSAYRIGCGLVYEGRRRDVLADADAARAPD